MTHKSKLCGFIITESAGIDWSADNSQLERILVASDDPGIPRTDGLRRDVYLYEILAFALALKVISGGEAAERYRELLAEGYEQLIERHERVTV